MKDLIKKIELRSDGFLELQLKKLKDFDDYLFQQIQQDGNCLPCVRDYRSKTKLYFDTKGYRTLGEYLSDHIFERDELLSFLLYLFEYLVKVNATKPIWFSMEYIYLCADASFARFLVLPIVQDNWLFQKEDCRVFLEQMIQKIQVILAYDVIGYLVEFLKEKDMQLPSLLQGFHRLKSGDKKKAKWWDKFFHVKEEPFRIQGLPQPIAYPNIQEEFQVSEQTHTYPKDEIKKDTKNKKKEKPQELHETVVLFQPQGCYLEEVTTGKKLYFHSDTITIGRSPDNDLCIPAASISSYHALLYTKTKELEDLRSSNGTFLNGNMIHKEQLQTNDQVTFADVSYLFVDE